MTNMMLNVRKNHLIHLLAMFFIVSGCDTESFEKTSEDEFSFVGISTAALNERSELILGWGAAATTAENYGYTLYMQDLGKNAVYNLDEAAEIGSLGRRKIYRLTDAPNPLPFDSGEKHTTLSKDINSYTFDESLEDDHGYLFQIRAEGLDGGSDTNRTVVYLPPMEEYLGCLEGTPMGSDAILIKYAIPQGAKKMTVLRDGIEVYQTEELNNSQFIDVGLEGSQAYSYECIATLEGATWRGSKIIRITTPEEDESTVEKLRKQLDDLQKADAAQTEQLRTRIETLKSLIEENENELKEREDQKKAQKFVRIINPNNDNEITTAALKVHETFDLRAGLFDIEGNYISDVKVLWTISNPNFSDADLQQSAGGDATATFSPSNIGQLVIRADYTGSDATVTGNNDTTGEIAVTTDSVPKRLSAVSGEGQTTTVNQILTNTLRVRVLDAFDDPIEASPVTFSVVVNNGQIIETQPSLTDADGYAEVNFRLGTLVGQNMVRVTSNVDPQLVVDFTATGNPAAAASVSFSQEPNDNSFILANFDSQPIIRVTDAFGNLVSESGNVDLTVSAGTGNLLGSTSAALNGGIATFSKLQYDTAENDVQIRATFSSVFGDSTPFDVSGTPPGACQVEDAYFKTEGGGCKDLTTGVIWSARSPSTMTHSEVVWDVLKNPGTQDEWDFGRSRDHSSTNVTDDHLTNYCHDLVEGGQQDWRAASKSRLEAVYNNSVTGGNSYLESFGNFWVWSGTLQSSDNGNAMRVSFTDGSNGQTGRSGTHYTYCVRTETIEDPTQILVAEKPAVMNVGSPNYGLDETAILVRLYQANGTSSVAQLGLPVTIATDTGNITGTTSLETPLDGKAIFDDLVFDTPGLHTLTITAEGYPAITTQIRIGEFPNTCKNEGAVFTTADGGCKHIASDLVFARRSTLDMNWYQAVWGYQAGVFNIGDPPDADDNGETDDYTNDPGTHPDQSTVNYCHSLVEGGYSDWRMPSSTELGTANAAGLHSQMGIPEQNHWTGSTRSTAQHTAIAKHTSGSTVYSNKTSVMRVICVREP